MAKIEIHYPGKMVSTGAYSAAVAIDGWLYISGHGPVDMQTGQPVRGTVEEETRLVLRHIGTMLQAAGCTFDDVVKCTCHLADIGEFDRFNGVYREFFSGVLPARTTVQSVLCDGIKVEIDAIARMKEASCGTA
jgi:2-iminobutanoate/2-iminopropanoate deaminase